MKKTHYPDFKYLHGLALQAGRIMLKSFRRVEATLKSDGTLVTKADREINKLVIESISRDFPHINIISEENSHKVSNAEYTVLCDPIDGTIPFCFGVPISSFCISVIKENMPLVGLIYDPFCKRIWHAVRNKGSFVNSQPIRVSQRDQICDSNLCMTWWRRSPYNLNAVCAKIMEAEGDWINPNSIAYFGGLVASGNLDATIFPGQKGWETAAMQVIIEEAGGKVTDIYGNKMAYGSKGEIKGHITSNGLIHDKLVALVQSCQ